MNTSDFDRMNRERTERRLRELSSDLADRVVAGEISDLEANEIYSQTADRWMAE